MKVLHKAVTRGEKQDGLAKEPEVPALPTNLVKIGSVYKYRSRIPQDLLRFYRPKKEITESLHTKSLAEAKRLLPAVQLKYQVEWSNLRAAISDDFTELPLNDATIQYLTAAFEHESLAGDEATRLDGNYTLTEIQDYRERLTESIDYLRDVAAVGDIEVVKPALEEYLRLKKLKVIGSESAYRQLALAYLRGAVKTNAALLERMQGGIIPTPPPVTSPLPEINGAKTSLHDGITLHSLFEYWRDAVRNRPARTVEDFARRVAQMDELTGHKPADQLSKADFVQFRDAMLAKGKATATVEKDLSFLKTIMRYAHESEKIPSNPTAGIKVSQRKVSQNAPRELSPDDLTKLFDSPIYREQQRPLGGGREAAAWIPILSLYTGARLEELCQLRVEDIGRQEGVHYLRIINLDDEEEGIQTDVKTDESRRKVPLHADVINAGFLAYVEHVKKQKSGWLFPDLTPDRYSKRGGNWGKWWSRWRKARGVTGRSKCFHAFRHTFKTSCRESEIGEDLHDAITGHSGGGIGRDYGKFSLKALDTAMQKVRHPEFNLNWVWEAPTLTRRTSVTSGVSHGKK